MAATFTTIQEILKEDYRDPTRESLNQKFFILSQVERNSDAVSGLRAYHNVHVARSSGVGARAESGTLPAAGNQEYINPTIPLRYNYGRIQLSGPVIDAASQSRTSFERALQSEMDGIEKDLHRDVNRQIWGSSNGVICGVTVAANTTVIGIDTADQNAVVYRQLGDDGSKMFVDIGDDGEFDDSVDNILISSVDTTNGTITLASAQTTAGTDSLVRTSAGGASTNSGSPGDNQKELTGLQTIVGTGNLYGITAAGFPTWQAGTSTSVGQLTETAVNVMIQQQQIKSGESINLLVCSDGVSRAAANLLEATRRHVNTVDLLAGYSGVQWSVPLEGMQRSGAIALVYDRDTPSGNLFGLSTKSLVQYEMHDWDWMDRDGAVLHRVADTDAYEGTFFKYHELAVVERNHNFRMTGVTEAN